MRMMLSSSKKQLQLQERMDQGRFSYCPWSSAIYSSTLLSRGRRSPFPVARAFHLWNELGKWMPSARFLRMLLPSLASLAARCHWSASGLKRILRDGSDMLVHRLLFKRMRTHTLNNDGGYPVVRFKFVSTIRYKNKYRGLCGWCPRVHHIHTPIRISEWPASQPHKHKHKHQHIETLGLRKSRLIHRSTCLVSFQMIYPVSFCRIRILSRMVSIPREAMLLCCILYEFFRSGLFLANPHGPTVRGWLNKIPRWSRGWWTCIWFFSSTLYIQSRRSCLPRLGSRWVLCDAY